MTLFTFIKVIKRLRALYLLGRTIGTLKINKELTTEKKKYD